MTASANRLVCARCGANNFDTQAACWKCGAPLGTAAAPPAPMPPQNSAAAGAPPAGSLRAQQARPTSSAPLAASPVAPVMAPISRAPAPSVDPAVANWTGIIAGLLMPYIMFPVGVVFLMLDDRRKLEIGRITLIASVVGTVLHLVVTGMLFGATLRLFMDSSPQLAGMAEKLKEAREGAAAEPQDPNQEVAPLELPGIPRTPEQPRPRVRLE